MVGGEKYTSEGSCFRKWKMNNIDDKYGLYKKDAVKDTN